MKPSEVARNVHKVIPVVVLLGVALWGLLSMAAVSQNASYTSSSAKSGAPAGSSFTREAASGKQAGVSGKLASGKDTASSGRSSPISYQAMRKSYEAAGRVLFEATCASCHGANAYGTSRAPSLVGLGAGTVDLWVSNGWMPLENLTSQPAVKPPKYTTKQSQEIADFVASLSRVNGPGIPQVNLRNASVQQGMSLFALNCAACHTITGSGDELASGYFAPTLHLATKTQVVEAARTGPGNMPRFSPKQLSNKELADIDAYLTRYIQHPVNRGGLALGGVGPVAEGFIALLVGVGGLMLAAFWIGDHRR
ncbi:MAG: cytochrome bc1 complex diheme cytochrome c subunit [Acidimicrobiales bacterium]